MHNKEKRIKLKYGGLVCRFWAPFNLTSITFFCYSLASLIFCSSNNSAKRKKRKSTGNYWGCKNTSTVKTRENSIANTKVLLIESWGGLFSWNIIWDLQPILNRSAYEFSKLSIQFLKAEKLISLPLVPKINANPSTCLEVLCLCCCFKSWQSY